MNVRLIPISRLADSRISRDITSLAISSLLLYMSLLMFGESAAYALGWDDPLATTPKVIQTGRRLPGDNTAAPCPVHKDFSSPLSLDEAIDLTLCNNPQVQMDWANIKIQAGALGEASATYLPTLSGSLSRVRDKTTYPDLAYADSDFYNNLVTASLSWRIFDFGVRSAKRSEAVQLLTAALNSEDATVQKTLSTAVQAYFDVITARATLKAKTDDETIAKKILASAKKRAQQGAAGNSDVLQAMTALAKSSLSKNRAQGDYHKALSVLVYTLGIPGETRIKLPDEVKNSPEVDRRDLKGWLRIAKKYHPAILAAKAQLNAANHEIDATSAEGLPTIDFSANYYQNGRPGQSLVQVSSHETTIGITVTIPLFDGFARTYKVAGAKAKAEEKAAELQDAEHQVVMNVVKTYADVDSALHNLQASEALLNAASNALAVVEHKYNQGAADIQELLNTQAALVDAQQQRIQCLDEWRSSRLKLLASTGRLNRAAVIQ